MMVVVVVRLVTGDGEEEGVNVESED